MSKLTDIFDDRPIAICVLAIIIIFAIVGGLWYGAGLLTAWFVAAMFGFVKPWYMWSVAWTLLGWIGGAFRAKGESK